MRAITFVTLSFLVALLAGCATRRPTPELVGAFRNAEGRHLFLEPNGDIYESDGSIAGTKRHFVGIASPERKHPGNIFVVTPSTGSERWMGVTLIFSSDSKSFDVFGYPPDKELTKAPKDHYERAR